jgi:hypothetical protein
LRKVLKINQDGIYIEDIILPDGAATPPGCIETPCPEGFFLPKWDGVSWVEGMTQEDITAMTNTVVKSKEDLFIEELDKATTIASVKLALKNYIG